MKKFIVFLVMTVLMASLALGASVDRTMPSLASPGSSVTVKLDINGIQSQDTAMALEDILPVGAVFNDWSISGTSQAKEDITVRQEDNKVAWAFVPSGLSATITYTITIAEEGTYQFGPLVWFDRSGMSPADAGMQTITIRNIVCGDSICDSTENYNSCPSDCAAPVITPPDDDVMAGETTTTTIPAKDDEQQDINYKLIMLVVGITMVIVAVLLLIKRKKAHHYHRLK